MTACSLMPGPTPRRADCDSGENMLTETTIELPMYVSSCQMMSNSPPVYVTCRAALLALMLLFATASDAAGSAAAPNHSPVRLGGTPVCAAPPVTLL